MTAMKSDPRIAAGVGIFLVAIVWLVFGQTLNHGFVNYDDEKYVFKNPHVTGGLRAAEVVGAFTHARVANWHPLTWISHMVDCQFYGLNPRGHHASNVLLHAATAVLLFVVLGQMSGSLWRSAFVATVFAIHPLRAESVAWVAERKDVLSGLFFMLTLGAYLAYVRKPSVLRYVTMSILYACGLMAKPMLVTLPVVLLLLDHWPLRRIVDLRRLRALVLEKIPLFALSAASCLATLLAQRGGGDAIDDLSLSSRLASACVATVIYIWQLIYPRNLAIFYPHPKNTLPISLVTMAILLLVAATVAVIISRRSRPYLFTGWFWFLVMLLPVIGIVQGGWQAHADRYTYLPHVGLLVAGTWAVAESVKAWSLRREIIAVTAAVAIAALAWQAWIQTSYWRESKSLWSHAIAVTSRNATAHNNLGTLLAREGRRTEAMAEFQKALEADPRATKANYNLAGIFVQDGKMEEAIAHYKKELQIHADADAEKMLGDVLLQTGRTDEAIDHFRRLLELRPKSSSAHYALAVALHRSGRFNEAIVYYEKVVAMKPDHQSAQRKLAEVLKQTEQFDESKLHDKK